MNGPEDNLNEFGHDKPVLGMQRKRISATDYRAIDNILSSHEGQAEHAELEVAFHALEAALNKAEGLPA